MEEIFENLNCKIQPLNTIDPEGLYYLNLTERTKVYFTQEAIEKIYFSEEFREFVTSEVEKYNTRTIINSKLEKDSRKGTIEQEAKKKIDKYVTFSDYELVNEFKTPYALYSLYPIEILCFLLGMFNPSASKALVISIFVLKTIIFGINMSIATDVKKRSCTSAPIDITRTQDNLLLFASILKVIVVILSVASISKSVEKPVEASASQVIKEVEKASEEALNASSKSVSQTENSASLEQIGMILTSLFSFGINAQIQNKNLNELKNFIKIKLAKFINKTNFVFVSLE